ncbi:MAG: hypothetical protein HY960_05970 [Ignavibacteriae bacterium]|nr:hypothetical protein [Ignavibacteriota bacterium]
MKRLFYSFLLVCFFAPSFTLSQEDGKQPVYLPSKLNTAIDKILDDQFAEIEKTLVREERLDPKEVLLITVPLENYIEDVLFTINRPATIYPLVIYSTLRTLFREGKPKAEIEQILIDMQKSNQFRKLYEAQRAE